MVPLVCSVETVRSSVGSASAKLCGPNLISILRGQLRPAFPAGFFVVVFFVVVENQRKTINGEALLMWGWYALFVGAGAFVGLANAAVPPVSRCALGCSNIAVPAAPCDSSSGFCCDPTAAPCPYPADLDNSTATFGGCQPGSSMCSSGLPCVSSWSYSQSCDVMCSRTAPNASCQCELHEIAWCKSDLACEDCQLCSGPNGSPCPEGGICVNQVCSIIMISEQF